MGVRVWVRVRVWVWVWVGPLFPMVVPLLGGQLQRMRPEDMRVYKLARELAKEVDRIIAKLPPSLRRIADHIERSLESAGLNLAEGLTAFKPGVKANSFEISRKEMGEVRKGIERAYDREGVTSGDIERAMALSNSYIGMLTVMIKQQEKRREDEK